MYTKRMYSYVYFIHTHTRNIRRLLTLVSLPSLLPPSSSFESALLLFHTALVGTGLYTGDGYGMDTLGWTYWLTVLWTAPTAASKGNKTEQAGLLVISIILGGATVMGNIYYIGLQVYV